MDLIFGKKKQIRINFQSSKSSPNNWFRNVMNLNEIRKLTQRTAIPTILTVEQASSDLVHHCQQNQSLPANDSLSTSKVLLQIRTNSDRTTQRRIGRGPIFRKHKSAERKIAWDVLFRDSSIFFFFPPRLFWDDYIHFGIAFARRICFPGDILGLRSFRHWEESEQRFSGRPSVLPNRHRLWFRNRNRIIIQQKKTILVRRMRVLADISNTSRFFLNDNTIQSVSNHKKIILEILPKYWKQIF